MTAGIERDKLYYVMASAALPGVQRAMSHREGQEEASPELHMWSQSWGSSYAKYSSYLYQVLYH